MGDLQKKKKSQDSRFATRGSGSRARRIASPVYRRLKYSSNKSRSISLFLLLQRMHDSRFKCSGQQSTAEASDLTLITFSSKKAFFYVTSCLKLPPYGQTAFFVERRNLFTSRLITYAVFTDTAKQCRNVWGSTPLFSTTFPTEHLSVTSVFN